MIVIPYIMLCKWKLMSLSGTGGMWWQSNMNMIIKEIKSSMTLIAPLQDTFQLAVFVTCKVKACTDHC